MTNYLKLVNDKEVTTAHTSAEAKRFLITILLLVFFYPIGVIAMIFLTKWPLWLKSLVALPLTLGLLLITGIISLILLIMGVKV